MTQLSRELLLIIEFSTYIFKYVCNKVVRQRMLQLLHHSHLQNLHSAAYQGGLGRPLVCPEHANLNFEIARQWFEEHYNAKRIVVAVGGMFEHEHVVELLKPLVSTMPGTPVPTPPQTLYVGGESHQ